MLRLVVMTGRLHICDMFDEMFVMASRGPIKSLIKFFALAILFQCYLSFLEVSWSFGQWLDSYP